VEKARHSMNNQDHPPPGYFLEIPAHLGIVPTDAVLRALLDAPADLPLTQWYISLSDRAGRRLAGLSWKVVGTIVPVTADRPGYPYVQHTLPEPRRLQAWLWRIFKPPQPPYPRPLPPGWMRPFGDLRWHPERGLWISLELGPGGGPKDRLKATGRVLGWVHFTQKCVGRPLVDDASLVENILQWMQERLAQGADVETLTEEAYVRYRWPDHYRTEDDPLDGYFALASTMSGRKRRPHVSSGARRLRDHLESTGYDWATLKHLACSESPP
jgi:hypothetical protein